MKSRWLMLAGVLMVGAVLALLHFSQRSPYGYEPTGDELYDKFAILVLKQLPRHPYHEIINEKLEPTGLELRWDIDYSEIAEWEDDFGDDPRYWQLRWLCEGLEAWPSNDMTDVVIQKIEDGVVDEGSYRAITYFALRSSNPRKSMSLIEQAINLSPDNSHFYYVKTRELLALGDREGALNALRAGNNAPRNEMPRIYPLDLMADHPEYFEDTANQAVGGALLYLSLHARGNHFLQWEQIENIVNASYSGEIPLDVADDLLVFARRFGEQRPGTDIQAIRATALIGIALYRVQQDSAALTPEQNQRLQKLVDLRDKFIDEVGIRVDTLSSQQKVVSPYQRFADWWIDIATERAFVESECLPILKEMSAIRLAD